MNNTQPSATETDIFSFGTVEEATAWVFSEGGPIAARGYEIRESQRELALACARRIDAPEKGWSLGEAPCGTGKGFAYLIPGAIAALMAERNHKAIGGEGPFPKVVVSTANIALQEQLLKKDVPAVADLLGFEVRAVLRKGRANYLCRTSLAEAQLEASIDPPSPALRDLFRWAADTQTGDKEELSFNPGGAWSKVSSTSDACAGKKCPLYSTCYAEVAKRGEANAHVVIVNHALLPLLRNVPALFAAIDEAHELESYLRGFNTAEVSEGTVRALAARIGNVLNDADAHTFKTTAMSVFDAFKSFFKRNAGEYDRELSVVEGWVEGWSNLHLSSLDPIYDIANAVAAAALREQDENRQAKIKALAKSVSKLHNTLWSVMAAETHPEWQNNVPGPWALWGSYDRRYKSYKLHASPADISSLVGFLQVKYPAAMLTSATLTAAGRLNYFRLTLGLPKIGESNENISGPVEELILPSPYPLDRMGLTVVPQGPGCKDPRWKTWAADQVVEAVQRAGGRTLVLCTSVAQMRRYTQSLRDQTSFEIKSQGDEGRSQLRRWFTETTEGVLVATRSFFQGLDVQGDSCVQVIIDRVPFTPPNPLDDAVGKLLVQRSGKRVGPFMLRSLPEACMVLAQGAGRLIRSQTDRGVLVCLDNRILGDRPMSKALRQSLPPFPGSRNLEDISSLLDGSGGEVIPFP